MEKGIQEIRAYAEKVNTEMRRELEYAIFSKIALNFISNDVMRNYFNEKNKEKGIVTDRYDYTEIYTEDIIPKKYMIKDILDVMLYKITQDDEFKSKIVKNLNEIFFNSEDILMLDNNALYITLDSITDENDSITFGYKTVIKDTSISAQTIINNMMDKLFNSESFSNELLTRFAYEFKESYITLVDELNFKKIRKQLIKKIFKNIIAAKSEHTKNYIDDEEIYRSLEFPSMIMNEGDYPWFVRNMIALVMIQNEEYVSKTIDSLLSIGIKITDIYSSSRIGDKYNDMYVNFVIDTSSEAYSDETINKFIS